MERDATVFARRIYPNYEGEASSQLEAAFGSQKYQRLLALKKKYDPDNFFRLNQNIDPGQRT